MQRRLRGSLERAKREANERVHLYWYAWSSGAGVAVPALRFMAQTARLGLSLARRMLGAHRCV